MILNGQLFDASTQEEILINQLQDPKYRSKISTIVDELTKLLGTERFTELTKILFNSPPPTEPENTFENAAASLLAHPKVTGHYQHYKGGIYELLHHGLNTENLQWEVVYKSSYNELILVRPSKMFFETVIVDGIEIPRFKRIS